VSLKHFLRSRIDAIAPRREDANVTPVSQVGSDDLAGFIDFDRQSTRDEMRGRSESDRSAANDSDRKIVKGGHR
jgi:hypothetical protein